MAQAAFPHFHIVILCEDYGAKLWPIAREQDPACLTPVEPGSEQSLLAAAVHRSVAFTANPLHVVTTISMAEAIHNELQRCPEAKKAGVDLIIQPIQRGTAFAIALAAARIRRDDPQAVIAVLRADTRMALDDRWQHLLLKAYQVAQQDRMVVVGSQQQDKCVDFTYILKGRPFYTVEDAYEVRLFSADAPDNAARRLCQQGAFWYTGVLVSRAAVVLGELARAGEMNQTPESGSSHQIAETANFLAMLQPEALLRRDAKEVVSVLPNVSFEKAVLEVSDKLVVIPTTIPFSTLRSLADLDSFAAPTRDGNRDIDSVALINRCHNVTAYSQQSERKVVAVGLRDVHIIELEDMTLVVNKAYLNELGDVRTQFEDQAQD